MTREIGERTRRRAGGVANWTPGSARPPRGQTPPPTG